VREDVPGGELHRPARPPSALVHTEDGPPHARRGRAIARALARRDIAVLVPASPATLATALAQARTLGVPVRVETVASFHEGGGPSTVVTRAAHAWRLLRLSHGLLTSR
jgi:hypothetical protein